MFETFILSGVMFLTIVLFLLCAAIIATLIFFAFIAVRKAARFMSELHWGVREKDKEDEEDVGGKDE